MKDYFQRIVLELFKNIQKDEFLIINFDAEESNFVRLNKARIRQPGNVRQISMSLSLSNRDKRNLKSFVRLNGDFNRDLATLIRTLNYLRRELQIFLRIHTYYFQNRSNQLRFVILKKILMMRGEFGLHIQ